MEIGNKVFIDGYTSMAQQNSCESKIEKIEKRYDELTGEEFEIVLVDGDWYDARDGSCYSNKKSMYYIEFDEEDHIGTFLKSKDFQEKFHEQVKKDTWGNGIPMIYMDDDKNIISHWQDGTKDILDVKNPLIDKEFNLDLGSTPVAVKVVFVSIDGDVTVKYLNSWNNRFERFDKDFFNRFKNR